MLALSQSAAVQLRPLFLLLVLATTAAAQPQFAQPQSAQAQAARPIIRVVTLGDSITKGVRTGVTKKQTFASRIERERRANGQTLEVVNVGIGGERTDQALRRLDRVIALDPSIVTVMYGTNDSYVDQGRSSSRITLAAYRTNLTKIVIELLRRGILPVLMTEPRWSDDAAPNGLGENPNLRLEPYMEACRQTAREWRVPLVDHFAAWTRARAEGVVLHNWTTDGCHPNGTGHEKLAATMAPVLRRAIGPGLKTRDKLKSGEAIRVVCFGDSVTGVYYHTGSRRAYTDMLGIALRQGGPAAVDMVNAGISGNTTVDALARIERDVLDCRPDLVTVMFGLNDMTRVSLDDYRSNLTAIVEKCRNIGAEVVLATPNNVIHTSRRPTRRLIEYCDVVRELGQKLNVPVSDCYRELDAVRAAGRFDWRLLMSDAIHPNMDGHKRLAVQLAQTITRDRISLADISPPQTAVVRTLSLLRDGQRVRVLAMPPLDALIAPVLRPYAADAPVEVVSWPTAGLSLADIEQQAKSLVRSMKPDLVLIAVPRSASAGTDEAFANSYAWIMNWSLNFGSPTWDCLVVHPSVTEGVAGDTSRDGLIRRLVRAQDLSLIDRTPANTADDVTMILQKWFQRNATGE